jgi:metal-responsive CopG/Arc/MetJ family transcriptional regulator
MKQITVRVPEDLLDDLEAEAEAADVSRSEYVRDVLRTREDTERLRERLESREDRIDELESQLAKRNQIEEKVDVLAKRVEESQLTYAEKRQRMIDRASVAERLRWRVTGVPVDEYDAEE